jgi:hypothetical protein
VPDATTGPMLIAPHPQGHLHVMLTLPLVVESAQTVTVASPGAMHVAVTESPFEAHFVVTTLGSVVYAARISNPPSEIGIELPTCTS